MRKSIEQIDGMEERIIGLLGESNTLNAICQALDYDTKADIYNYIIRMYDLAIEEEE